MNAYMLYKKVSGEIEKPYNGFVIAKKKEAIKTLKTIASDYGSELDYMDRVNYDNFLIYAKKIKIEK